MWRSLAQGAWRRLRAGTRARAAEAWVGAGRALRRGAQGATRLLWPLGRRHAAAAFILAVAAAGAWGLAFQARLPGRLPSALDWRSAAVLVARDARPGDAVLLDPWWAERAREVLPADLPVLAYPSLAGEDLLGVRRVWLLALPEAPGGRGPARGQLAALAGLAEEPQRLGALEVSRWDLRAPRVPLAFLPDRLAGATLSAGAQVTREVREVAFLPRACLLVRPPAGGGATTLTFPAVPAGRALRGHLGRAGPPPPGPERPVRLAVALDGRALGEARQSPGGAAWEPFELPTGAAPGAAGAVTLTVELDPAERGGRPACVEAYTVP